MHHKTKLTTVAVLTAAVMSASAWAQKGVIEPSQGWFVGAQLKHAEFDGDRKDANGNEIRRGTLAGLELGIDISDRFAWRLTAANADLNSDGAGEDESGMWYGADLLYHINDKRNYFILGADYIDLDNEATKAAHLGFGIRYNMTPSWVLTGEAMVHQGFDEGYSDFTAGIGIRYYFGGHKSEPKPAPIVQLAPVVIVDTDSDGVVDSLDECPATPVDYAVDSSGCTLYREETVSKRLMVNFANDSAKVPFESKEDIQELAEFMEKYPQLNVVIEGHTSSVGADDYNQQLSERRADAVSEILVSDYGIDGARVSAKGYGESNPLLKGNSEKIHAANRRIMAVLSVNEKVGIRK
ncbi:OmpA family protein [Ferrimonas sp.]|uniref:OmpA family protein n=1 Tax=Ferrimonas sp. TaxID=2080861 RepID=UPI003A8EBB31